MIEDDSPKILEKQKDERTRLNFPEWTTIIKKTNRLFQENNKYASPELEKRINYYLDSMTSFKDEYLSNPLNVLFNFAYGLLKKTKENFEPGIPNDQALALMKAMQIGSNEFYTLFDITKNDYTIVDQRITEVLGFSPKEFNLFGMLGLKPNKLVFHPVDICHMSRSALVAYMVICIPGFKWKAQHDFYRARTRINVSKSKHPEIREAEWLTLEKRVYMSHYETEDKNFIPLYHMKRWTVYDESEYNGTSPYFGGNPFQSKFRNIYWYLLHAYMLNIPIKYILMLHERQTKDRYKAIAMAINKNIAKFNKFKTEFDEGQVADCFAKTIRPKISELINIWEGRSELLEILSDQDAVAYGRKLGLLPIPKKVLELIYNNIGEM